MTMKCNEDQRPARKEISAAIACCHQRQSCYTNNRKRFVVSMSWIATVCIVYIFTTVASAVDEIEFRDEPSVLLDCPEVESLRSEIIAGWPFNIDCTSLLLNASEEWIYDDVSDVKCIVVSGDNSIILHEANVTAGEEVYDLYDAYSDPYEIESTSKELDNSIFTSYLINGDSCFKVSHTLSIQEPTNVQPTCDEQVYDEGATYDREMRQGDREQLNCVAKLNSFYLTGYEVTWYKDCKAIATTEHDSPENAGEVIVGTLEIDATFESAGEYTCSVTYNGSTIFLSKTNVCVTYKQYPGPPTFIQVTPEVSTATVGDDVTLTCGGTSGPIGISFLIFWIKNVTSNESSDVCFLGSLHSTVTNEDKHICSITSNSEEASRCFHDPKEAEKSNIDGITRVNSSLTIRNFQPSDAGEYICKVVTTRDPVQVSFTLNEYQADPPTKAVDLLVIILPTIAGALLVVLIFALLCICIKRGDFKKQWKESLRNTRRSTGGAEERGNGIDHLSASAPDCQSKGRELPAEV